jgi:hypothetical protein
MRKQLLSKSLLMHHPTSSSSVLAKLEMTVQFHKQAINALLSAQLHGLLATDNKLN